MILLATLSKMQSYKTQMIAKTVSNTTPNAILNACSQAGIDVENLLEEVGIEKNIIQNPNGRVAIEDVVKLWDISLKKTKDRMIGISASHSLSFGAYKFFDYIFATSATPKDGLASAFNYYPLINSAFELSINIKGDWASIELHNPSDDKDLQPQYVDFVFACTLYRVRFSCSSDWNPCEVSLACAEPAEISAHHQLYQSPVRYNQTVNRMIVEKEKLEILQPSADPFLCEMLRFYAQNQMKRLPVEKDLIYEIRKVLFENIRTGKLDLDSTARQLAMSRRNLQRKLSQHKTSYRNVLEQVRSEIAQNLLKSRNVEIDEIAYLVGFEEENSFHRAFKKWTGKTPNDFLQN